MAVQREKRAKGEAAPAAAPAAAPEALAKRTPLYTPFRALGYVSNGVPFVMQVRFGGKDAKTPDVNVVTCVGDAWAMWNADRMTLLFVGPMLQHAISSMAISTSPDSLLAAAGPTVHRYVRGREVAAYETEDEALLGQLIVFGDYVVALAADGHAAYVWSLATNELLQTLDLAGWTASCVVHPATYLNKVVIGGADGSVQLWNVRTGQHIHTFGAQQIRGTPAGVVSVTQSPAVDVLAVAYADGDIVLLDVRLGSKLFAVHVDGGLAAGCIAFRTDGEAHTLAVATRAGSLVLFDLAAAAEEDGAPRLLHSVQHAHDGAIGAIEFVPGQPLLISSGADNAVKQWFFESPTLPPRLLKFRSGHALPPHIIRYYGDDGRSMLTASRDKSVRSLSVVRDSRSFELSQGSVESRASKLDVDATSLKLPPVSSLSYSTTRSRDWDDVLTTHANDRYAHTWTVRDKHMNKSPLSVARTKKSLATGTAACVSACGNFALIGTSKGAVEMYNMQSHLYRRTFATGSEAPVTDIACDAVNAIALVSTQEPVLHFFDFHTGQRTARVTMPAPIAALRLHRESNLVAALGEDLELYVLDLETQRVARRFGGFRGRLLDAAFSADGRWIVTCSTDSVVRTFDIATAQLIDAFRTPSIATSVAFSPLGDFLATAHVDSVGVHLWVNRAQFAPVPLRALPIGEAAAERDAALPTMQGAALDEAPDADVGEPELQRTYTSPPQLEGADGPLLTLSTMPRSRWITLLHLDTIRQRNKPTEAPKKPEKAPFFLDTGNRAPLGEAAPMPEDDAPTSHRTHTPIAVESAFERRLRVAVEAEDVAALFTYLHTLSAPQFDVAIRSLETPAQQTLFLQALALRLRAQRDWEAVQAMLAVFLAVHAEGVQQYAADPSNGDEEGAALGLALRTLLAEQQRESARVLQSLDYCMGTLSFLRNVPLL